MDKITRTCCAGGFCTSPHLQLWHLGHFCSICKGIVHLNRECSIASLDENGNDVFKCVAFLQKNSVPFVSSTSTNTNKKIECTPVAITMSVNKKVKHSCPKCGGTNHQWSSSNKCKFDKANKKTV